MPIKIPDTLPALSVLESERIFVMTHDRAIHQDIRPLKILILNLMPTKIETETQLLRLLSNSSLQVEIELLQTASHVSRNTPARHLLTFYKVFSDVKHNYYDGMIITGAPVEMLEFEDVDYWEELCAILEWSKIHVFSTFHICWGAQAGLYYHHGVKKHRMDKKLSGIYSHRKLDDNNPLLRGFDDIFFAPHSRYTEVYASEIESKTDLVILSDSAEAGVYIVASKDGRQFYVSGHSEYDRDTLAKEYFRDINKGLEIDVPYNYFPDDDAAGTPPHTWKAHANLLYANWLNYFLYQLTPYDLDELDSSAKK